MHPAGVQIVPARVHRAGARAVALAGPLAARRAVVVAIASRVGAEVGDDARPDASRAAQVRQTPVHAFSQQTPSAQWPLSHCSPRVHPWPMTAEPVSPERHPVVAAAVEPMRVAPGFRCVGRRDRDVRASVAGTPQLGVVVRTAPATKQIAITPRMNAREFALYSNAWIGGHLRPETCVRRLFDAAARAVSACRRTLEFPQLVRRTRRSTSRGACRLDFPRAPGVTSREVAMAIEQERRFLVQGAFPKTDGVAILQGTCRRSRRGPCASGRRATRHSSPSKARPIRPASASNSSTRYRSPMPGRCSAFARHTRSKTRYHVNDSGFSWEIDEFHGHNDGLVIAEMEGAQEVIDGALEARPAWLGEDVTTSFEYANARLSERPFTKW